MKKRILISGIYYEGSGLGKVMNYLTHNLSVDFEITCIAFLTSNQLNEQKWECGECNVYHVSFRGNKFILPREHELSERIKNNGYDAIILLGPISMNTIFIDQLKKLNDKMRLIHFLPYEGKVINTYDAPTLNKIDFGVFYSRFTYDCYNEVNTDPYPIHTFQQRFGYVYHGVDTEMYYPIAVNRKDKIKTARSFIKEYENLPDDAFVILNSNRPFYRKGFDSTLAAFKKFSSHFSNTYLHLHLGNISTSCYDVTMREIEAYALHDKVILTHSAYPSKAHSDEWMNHLYNACNVGLSTSYGEGWGMGVFEHAATGAPVIVPGHTSFIENWKDVALLTTINEVKYMAFENTEIYLPSVDAVYHAIIQLYVSNEQYEKYAINCYRHATSPKYNWKNTSDYFKKIILNGQIELPDYLVC